MINLIKAPIALFCILISFSAFGQGPVIPEIKERIIAFMELANAKNYNAAFDFMYPRMFELVSKQEMVDAMKTMEQNGLSISTHSPVIDSFSFPFMEGNEKFVRINYRANLKVDIITGSMFDTPAMCDGIQGQFESIYGNENVKWNKDEKRYDVVTKTAMIAIQPDGGEWYLIEIRPDQMNIMKALFSETIIKKFIAGE